MIPERLVPAAELAELLSMKPDRVLRLFERGDIPGHKIGRAVRFDPVEILELTRRPGRRLARPRLSLEDRSENPDDAGGDDAS